MKQKGLSSINAGTVIYFVIFIYVIIRVIISFQNETLSIYEVQSSYIDTNINTTALTVREEKLVNATKSGYVSYYVRDGEKIGKNKTVYTIDETGSVYNKIKDSNSDSSIMSAEGLSEVRTRISNFENFFNYSDFSDIYNFHYDIENAVLELTNEAMIDQMTILDNDSDHVSTYQAVTTPESGIITYYQDGYEDFDVNSFKASDIDKSTYKKNTLKTGKIVNSGDPVYKLVTSENWYLVAPITKEETKRLKDESYVCINIHNSSKNINCNFELTNHNNTDFIIISLNQQMVNYINNRYIDIVILMDQNKGLKIPNISIAKKNVYKIPTAYLSNGSDSTQKIYFNVKALDKKGEITIKQVKSDIYKSDEEFCYVNPDIFKPDDVLVNIGNNETFALANAPTEQ